MEYEQKEYGSGKDLKYDQRTDILLLDIEMRDISGIQLKEWLQQDENIKILFLTSHMKAIMCFSGKSQGESKRLGSGGVSCTG